MHISETQSLRCPCCGATFRLTEALSSEEDQPQSVDPEPAPSAEPVSIVLVFDGGSIGNPGKGYGSYQLTVRGKAERPKRLEFGPGYTNNEAEYDTLIAALQTIIRRAKDPQRVQLDIRGDSQLVINQITGAWKVKEPRLQERVRQVHVLLKQLGSWQATWQDRAKTVEALGH